MLTIYYKCCLSISTLYYNFSKPRGTPAMYTICTIYILIAPNILPHPTLCAENATYRKALIVPPISARSSYICSCSLHRTQVPQSKIVFIFTRFILVTKCSQKSHVCNETQNVKRNSFQGLQCLICTLSWTSRPLRQASSGNCHDRQGWVTTGLMTAITCER